MPVIGITGGIATGKSTVTRMLGELGVVTLSADDSAREVVAPGSEGLRSIVEAFGSEVLLPDGSLDRQKVASLVFARPEARRTLESISHPLIMRRLKEQIEAVKQQKPDAFIAVETPLLYEAGMEDWFDWVVVVSAPGAVQKARLAPLMPEEEAAGRIDAQMPLEEKEARADHVIVNTGSPESLRKQVRSLWKRLRQP